MEEEEKKDIVVTNPTPLPILPEKEHLKTISMLPINSSPKKRDFARKSTEKQSQKSSSKLKRAKSEELAKTVDEVSSAFMYIDKDKLIKNLAHSHYGGNSEKYFQNLGKEESKGRI